MKGYKEIKFTNIIYIELKCKIACIKMKYVKKLVLNFN